MSTFEISPMLHPSLNAVIRDCLNNPVIESSKPAWMIRYSDDAINYIRILLALGRIIEGHEPTIGTDREWADVTPEMFYDMIQDAVALSREEMEDEELTNLEDTSEKDWEDSEDAEDADKDWDPSGSKEELIRSELESRAGAGGANILGVQDEPLAGSGLRKEGACDKSEPRE